MRPIEGPLPLESTWLNCDIAWAFYSASYWDIWEFERDLYYWKLDRVRETEQFFKRCQAGRQWIKTIILSIFNPLRERVHKSKFAHDVNWQLAQLIAKRYKEYEFAGLNHMEIILYHKETRDIKFVKWTTRL